MRRVSKGPHPDRRRLTAQGNVLGSPLSQPWLRRRRIPFYGQSLTMKIEDIAQIPPDPPLAEEMSDDDVIFEMANLDKSQTGIDGFVGISTLMTGHAPRVKYFVRPGRTQPSFSVMISDPPRVVAISLPAHTVSRMAPLVIRWVSLNKGALLDFWYHGDTWPAAQWISFLQSFQRI
jgi:hypothetical protein